MKPRRGSAENAYFSNQKSGNIKVVVVADLMH